MIKNNEKLKQIISKYGILFILIGLILLISFISPAFLSLRNFINIIKQVSVVGIISMGVTIIIITKGIDLSSGSVLALSAVVGASLAQRSDWATRMFPSLGSVPLIVPILATLLIGALAGYVNGTLISKSKLPAFIATLGMMTVARGLALLYSDGRPISTLTDGYKFIGQGEILGIPFPIIIFIIIGFISFMLLNHTRFGRYAYAIGGNEKAALVSGIDVNKYKLLVYIYGGMLAGLAGLILSSRVNSGQPGMGNMYELDAIAASTIGGTSHSGGVGTIGGAIIGALIIGVLNNGLDLMNVSAYWQQVVKGVIIVGAVMLDMKKNKGTKK